MLREWQGYSVGKGVERIDYTGIECGDRIEEKERMEYSVSKGMKWLIWREGLEYSVGKGMERIGKKERTGIQCG